MYYTIDLEIVSKPVFTVPVYTLLPSDQGQQITAKSSPEFKKRIFYVAAAFIILGISLTAYFYNVQINERKFLPLSAESGQGNDVQTTSTPMNPDIDPQFDTILAADQISLSFIENQLLLLHKKGIENFILQQSILPAPFSTAEVFVPLYNKNIPVADCLEKIQAIKKYKSYLTISELVSFLNILEKQGA